ncbi:regulatory protein RecX [Leucobacter sp. HY1910]
MAVRFLPPPEERASTPRESTENLAEVVEMRSWLRATDADAAAEGDAPTSDSGATETESEVRSLVDESPRVDEPCVSAVPAAIPAGVEAECAEEEPADRGPAYDDAVRLLARRAKSSGELRADLLALEHPSDEVALVIDEFIDSHYLDDLGLARVQAEKLRSSKGASRGQITRKLRERKLPDAVIDEVIGELDTDEEYALLCEAAAKRAEKLGGLDRATAQRRLIGFLARRGWSGEPAMRAVNEALDGGGLGKRGRSGSGVRFE